MNTETYRKKLLALKRELAEERREGDEATGVVELDQSRVGRLSRMDALQSQAMSVAAQERRREHEQRVDAALQRIDNDDFGYCLDCGEEIAEERLAFDPSAPLCIACANRREQ